MRGWITAAAVLTGTVSPWAWTPAADKGDFPRGGIVDAQAAFWTNVYGRWSLSQVAVHDKECPALIYEIVDLPGAVGEAYTPAQEAFVLDVRATWEERLAEVAGKVDAGAALADEEKSL